VKNTNDLLDKDKQVTVIVREMGTTWLPKHDPESAAKLTLWMMNLADRSNQPVVLSVIIEVAYLSVVQLRLQD
jgi:hypothetical protein